MSGFRTATDWQGSQSEQSGLRNLICEYKFLYRIPEVDKDTDIFHKH